MLLKKNKKIFIFTGVIAVLSYNLLSNHSIVKANDTSVGYETVISSKKEYTVRFIAEKGGKLSGKVILKVEKDKKVNTIPKVTVSEGYSFMGWYLGTRKVNPQSVIIIGNTTFTAKFKKKDLKPKVNYQAMYRLYNKNTGEHFYTESSFERKSLVKGGWNDEGTGWFAPNKGVPVYRVYNPKARGGDHYYTASKYEANSLVKSGWKWDNGSKPVFYSGGKTKVYVAFNPNTTGSGAHNYTSSLFEQNTLLKNGWKFGKVQFYAK